MTTQSAIIEKSVAMVQNRRHAHDKIGYATASYSKHPKQVDASVHRPSHPAVHSLRSASTIFVCDQNFIVRRNSNPHPYRTGGLAATPPALFDQTQLPRKALGQSVSTECEGCPWKELYTSDIPVMDYGVRMAWIPLSRLHLPLFSWAGHLHHRYLFIYLFLARG